MHVSQPAPVSHPASQPVTHKDNLLGICAAIGEDFGFDPLYLRLALAVGILWNPLAMLTTYLAMGAVVLATRLIFPKPKTTAEVVAIEAPARREEQVELPLAA